MAGKICPALRQGEIIMPFPYPANPEEWQAAYSSDDAYGDSTKFRNNFALPIILCSLVVLAYIFVTLQDVFLAFVVPFFASYQPIQQVMFVVLTGAIFFLLFFVLLFKIASIFALEFFNKFYRPPENIDPMAIINSRLIGKPNLPSPLNMLLQFDNIVVKDGEIEKQDKWPAWSARNLGGPLVLIVFDGCALYLERGNRFSRVVGPGNCFLEWYETIKYVVDLRPKIKDGNFGVWTKDGINIKLTAQIECRIGDPTKGDPESGLVYPFDPAAVKKAVERTWVAWPNRLGGDPNESIWLDAAWGQVTGIVPGYIGSRMLDDLLMAERENGQILSPDAIKELLEKLNGATKGFGVYITDFQIVKVEMPDEVNKHKKEHWMAERQSIATVNDGRAKAFNIRSREKARADAQRDLILAIADGLEKNKSQNFSEPLLLSLSGMLDESLNDPLMRAYLAKETIDALNNLQDMLKKNE
jgi:regulator of protease activity HflC (stomatin/prohibitin superfamily)